MKHALIAFVAWIFTAAAQAQPWPAKPVRMVIPYPAGGSVDVSGRRLAATDYVAKAAPDGYTLLVSTLAAHAGNPAAVRSLPYDPVKDFAPVTVINTVPLRGDVRMQAAERDGESDPIANTPAEMAAMVQKDLERYAALFKAAGIQPE